MEHKDELFDLLRAVADAIDAGEVGQVKTLLDTHQRERQVMRAFIDDYIAYREASDG